VGGLQVANHVVVDTGAINGNDPRLGQDNIWFGAQLPTQTVANGKIDVTIEQTQSKAILNWQTFNVGKNTQLTFEQSKGGNEAVQWIALNRVEDPTAKPSVILGSIKAQGSVYVLNRNGVIFGGTSQVNTHSLLVSSLDLFTSNLATSNQTFVQSGLFPTPLGQGTILEGIDQLTAGETPGNITIQAGAQIASGSDGYTLIAAPNVSNAGSVTAVDGQVVLAAVLGIRQGQLLDTVNTNQLPISFENFLAPQSTNLTRIGSLTNTGLVSSTRGDATLVGYDVSQDGIVTATTSISRPGSIELLAINQDGYTGTQTNLGIYYGGILNFNSGSVTSVLPDDDGETTTSTPAASQAFVPSSMTLAGAQIGFNSGSLVLAPAATVNIIGWSSNPKAQPGRDLLTERIWMDSGSDINVAGIANVELPMSTNLIEIPLVGLNELADSPLQRDGVLYHSTLDFDRRDTGVREDGTVWVGSPILNAQGYVDQVPRTIDQLLLNGGAVNVTGHDFVMNPGAQLDLDGGFLHYLGGLIQTPRLVGADGRLYSLASADPMMTFTGIAGEQVIDHPRWGVQQTFSSPLLGSSEYYESDYVQGGNAGTLNINIGRNQNDADPAQNLGALVLGGDLSAQAVSGRYQILSGDLALGGALNLDTNATVLTDDTDVAGLEQRNWEISTNPAQVPIGLGNTTPVASLPGSTLPPLNPGNPGFWSVLSTGQVADAGFSKVAIGNAGLVTSDAGSNLQVANGGVIAINAGMIDLEGTLTAHAGTITLQSAGGQVSAEVPSTLPGEPVTKVILGTGDIVLGADARLDVSGLWVNDDSNLTDQPTGKAAINGGSISLRAMQNRAIVNGITYDATGAIMISPGAVLNASGGGYVNSDGLLATSSNGVPLGSGGNISLQTYLRPPVDSASDPTYEVNLPTLDNQTGVLQFQGAILLDNSFAGGGTLTLRALGIQIGGVAPTDPRILQLDPGLFDSQGFGGYNLSAELDATITAGTAVHVSQLNLLPNFNALEAAVTGTDVLAGLGTAGSNAYVAIGQLDPFHRPATNFSLSAGDYLGRFKGNPTVLPATGTLLLDQGASLWLDPGADVRLGSRGQLTILGDVTDHGGNVILSGDSSAQSGLSPADPSDQRSWFDAGKSVWLGADSVIDVSGISLVNPLVPFQPSDAGLVQPRDGVVLSGGSITLTNDTGYVVVQQGAQFNLSGASDVYDLPTDSSQVQAGANTLQAQSVWSNGGTLTVAASAGMYFDGSIHAAGGSAQASGGELVLLPEATPSSQFFGGVSATGIIFTQSDTHMPVGLAPGATVEPGNTTPSGTLFFAADLLDGSGIGTLVVGNQAPNGGGFAPPLVPIGFSGNVDLSVPRALIFDAPVYQMLPDGGSDFGVLGSGNNVVLNAAYVALNGFNPSDQAVSLPTLAQPNPTTLDVQANFIDIGGQFALSGVRNAIFDSTGDIRFNTPAPYAFEDINNPVAIPGELLTAGDIEFKAAQLYPASGQTFDVLALGVINPTDHARFDTVITVKGNGNQDAPPLSAGGTLAFDAETIDQDGTVLAPSGTIVLGITTPNDPGTQALFGGVTDLIRTFSVKLGADSLTSVSLDNAVLPYGTTVDDTDWQYDADPNGSNPILAAPPQKLIEVGGAHLTLDPGAQVNLSGGGDLQAVEWVPGTGGSRDLLSQYNTSYESGSPQQVPLYPDARGIYAIVPGLQSPVAAADPVFDQGASPIGVGSSVYLSGVPGLPPGVYTLLPAMYATLPGAFRVVQVAGAQDATSAQDFVQPDGTAVVSGYFVNALDGTRGARSTLFDVQSRNVWGQYSDYTSASANNYFSGLALQQGTEIPQLPQDAGQLILAATERLSLGATIDTAAASGGLGAEIDIAAPDLQVTDGNAPALAGYVQLDVSALDALNAGSLLIGGTREQTADGTQINVLADSVVVSNDAADPLHAPEILLVAGAGPSPNDGLHVDAGSVIAAQGTLSSNSIQPILIGSVANAATGAAAVSGDGALLRVSNAGDATLIRSDVPDFASAQGNLFVGAGAQILGGASLTLDSTGNTQVSADAVLEGKSITADAGNIRFVSGVANPAGNSLVIGADTLARFADADSVTLRSYGTIDFYGNIDVQIQNALTLSAGTFVDHGSEVSLGAGTLTLSNDLGAAPATATAAGSGVLSLRGTDVAFGDGDKTLSGFGAVNVDASSAVLVQDKGDFDFGALNVTLQAPVIEADTGADNTLQTTGTLSLLSGAGTAPTTPPPLGGSMTLEGGSIVSDALIRATSGNVNLHATSGDVDVNNGALIDVSGTEKDFFDVAAYSQAGNITLQSDGGSVNLAAGATLDFAANAHGGDAGALTVDAPTGGANLLGTLAGSAPKGLGGSFTLDISAAVDLDALTGTLAASGVDNAISVRTRTGNLVLSAGNTINANDVTLVADGGANSQQRDPDNGNIVIDGTIDASGEAGGSIALWGRDGVDVAGQLLAKGRAADELGGNVTIGTSGNADGTLNANYGYENVDAADAGVITLESGAVIDVSGGSAGGLSGGTVDIRAPLLTNGDVNVTVANGATITGARSVGLEAYAVWSTTDASTNPAQHFDGIIDPAGWYNAQGVLVAGTWTNNAGNRIPAPTTPAQLMEYLAKYFFTPTVADAAHSTFYGYLNNQTHTPGTLMSFVENPGFTFDSRFAGIANFEAQPGIELRNPDAAINGGNISVLTSWNLASGISADALDFRYHGNAPVLTLQADNDVEIKASISDGFYQTSNPFSGGGPQATFAQANADYQVQYEFYEDSYTVNIDSLLLPPLNLAGADPAEAKQYYGQYVQLLNLLFNKPEPALGSQAGSPPITLVSGFLIEYAPEEASTIQFFPGEPTAPAAPTTPNAFSHYLTSYEDYVINLYNFWGTTGFGNLPTWTRESLPVLGPLPPGAGINIPTLQTQLDNPLPLATAGLLGGSSTSYRIVAGADFTSTLPDAFRLASQGDVVLDGYTDYQVAGMNDVLQPTTVRTGTGSIEIVAAQDISMDNALAPASIYTAGSPAPGTSYNADVTVVRGGGTNPDVVVGAQANAEGAGDITLTAGRDILGNQQIFDPNGSLSTIAGNYIAQYWWPWLQVGAVLSPDGSTVIAAPINFGGFAQGVLSAGGNVNVTAGRDISELSVSLPTSYTLDGGKQIIYGGGNLVVSARQDVLGGDYFVALGNGSLSAGGSIGSAFNLAGVGEDANGILRDMVSPVDPVIALQDGHWSIQAGDDAAIGAIVNPAYQVLSDQNQTVLVPVRATTNYSTDSSVSVSALAGDVSLNTLTLPGELFDFGNRDGNNQIPVSNLGFDNVWPASVSAVALDGQLSIERAARMYPSADGELSLLADGNINLYDDTAVVGDTGTRGVALEMLDGPSDDGYEGDEVDPTAAQLFNLHRDDPQPVYVYSLNGSIVTGYESGGFMLNPLGLYLAKPARIRAGLDIVDLDLHGQNYFASDITSVIAGRDLYYTPIAGGPDDPTFATRWTWLQIGGPGTFLVEAGRNLGPLTSANEALDAVNNAFIDPDDGGIRTVGNSDNAGLPTNGATIDLRYGVGPGTDIADFSALYIDPTGADTTATYRSWLTDFVLQYENDNRRRAGEATLASLTPAAAWSLFQQLPDVNQTLLVDRVFLDVLNTTGINYSNPSSPNFGKYAPGYAAVETLFPSSLGYTANNLEGGVNGAAMQVATGNFDMRGSTVQTERGGDIRILGPGGGLLVGSASAPPTVVGLGGQTLIGPDQQGVLALGEGDIDIFNDGSMLLAQSRIFTEGGGDITLWSSNGDINAGKGAKTTSEEPPITYLCDQDFYCFVNAQGAVSGAGIATLQTTPDDPAGDAVLVAPRGTVDAGDAGIRVAGNLVVASEFVANGENIDVKGSSVGVSGAHGVDTGALSAASSAASAVADAANDLSAQRPEPVHDLPAIISVQVIGFGSCAPDDPRCKPQ
jgi:filamentous hemagglutinin family protein